MSDLATFSFLSCLLFKPRRTARPKRPAPTAPIPPNPLDFFFLLSSTLVGLEVPNQPVCVSLLEAPLPCLEYRSTVSILSVVLRFRFPRPKRASNPSKPALRIQQKHIKRSSITPAITPITIPAIAPALRPLDGEDEVTGNVLPLAVAAGTKGTVVDAESVEVVVSAPLLVGRTKGAPELVAAGMEL